VRILFITSAHNSLSQRLQIELADRGHTVVAVHLAGSDEAMGTAAVNIQQPQAARRVPRRRARPHVGKLLRPRSAYHEARQRFVLKGAVPAVRRCCP
jgi:hypothetical protein